ncbi:hypothetical protein [Sinomonas sp. ASV486]|uniref:hypothetical protein n=1 Tax=Sinomonas sp. ASV486 TaxID=3051170 RepID=UPI0027DE293D|nr:hypothetical protein [Sinomonas sp. ASV486]
MDITRRPARGIAAAPGWAGPQTVGAPGDAMGGAPEPTAGQLPGTATADGAAGVGRAAGALGTTGAGADVRRAWAQPARWPS